MVTSSLQEEDVFIRNGWTTEEEETVRVKYKVVITQGKTFLQLTYR